MNALRGPRALERVHASCSATCAGTAGRIRSRTTSSSGSRTASASGSTRSSSRPTPRRCGAFPCTEIRAEWAAQRIQGLSLAKAILSARGDQPALDQHQDPDQRVPVSRGSGPARCGRRAPTRSVRWAARCCCSTTPTPSSMSDGKVTAVRARTPDGEVRIEGEHVISTMPRALPGAGARPGRARRRCARPPRDSSYRDFLVVALILDGEGPLPGQLDLHPHPGRAGRPHPELQQLEPGDGPGSRARPAWAWSTSASRATGCGSPPTPTWSSWPPRSSSRWNSAAGTCQVVDGAVIRMPKAYPIYDSAYRGHLDAVRAYIDADPQPAHRGAQRHAQVQQPGPLHADGDDGRREHARRPARRLGGQHRLRVPRGAEGRRTAPGRADPPSRRPSAEPMRIGVDATCWANGRGYGRFTRELLPAMARLAPGGRVPLFPRCRVGRTASTWTLPNVRAVRVLQGQAPTEAASADGYRAPVGHAAADPGGVAGAAGRVLLAVGLHLLPAAAGPARGGDGARCDRGAVSRTHAPEPRGRGCSGRLKVRLALWQARLVLTVSDFAAAELAEVLGVAPGPHPGERRGAGRGVPAQRERRGDPGGGGAGGRAAGGALVRVRGRFQSAQARGCGRSAPMPPWPRELAEPLHLLLVGTIDKDVFHGDQARIRQAIADGRHRSAGALDRIPAGRGAAAPAQRRGGPGAALGVRGVRTARRGGRRLRHPGGGHDRQPAAGAARGRRDLRGAGRRRGADRRAAPAAHR